MIDINEINKMLEEGKTVKEIREDLEISEKAYQKQIKNMGYRYLQKVKKYVKAPPVPIKKHSSKTEVINKNKSKDLIVSDADKVSDLIKNYDDIKTMLDWFKNKEYENSIIEVIQDNRIKIDIETEETKRTTILINKKIYDDFNMFCQRHKEYDKKDLLSMALLEYMKKYD